MRWNAGAKSNHTEALLKASKLQDRASHREQQLILARMQEKGQPPGVGDGEARKRKAIATLDNLLALYDDDEEAWYYRAELAGGERLFGGQASSVPFYKALLRINPLHPGANHELLHYYENSRRPAPGLDPRRELHQIVAGHAARLPHAGPPGHAHRPLGDRPPIAPPTPSNWNGLSQGDARQAQRGFAVLPSPGNAAAVADPRWPLRRSAGHQGGGTRLRLQTLAALVPAASGRTRLERGRQSHRRNAQRTTKRQDNTRLLFGSSVSQKGRATRALPEIEVLQHALRDRPNDKTLQFRVWETQGWYMCQTGDADAGLKLLFRTVEKTKDDYSHHAWGQGAYYMELWGIAALKSGRETIAEEAFLEALAHDAGSVRAALGMQVLCEHQGRSEEARRFAGFGAALLEASQLRELQRRVCHFHGERYENRRVESDSGLRVVPR